MYLMMKWAFESAPLRMEMRAQCGIACGGIAALGCRLAIFRQATVYK
jgi:hypothetical protein